MWAALEVLPPKVLALSSSEPSKPVELLVEGLETRVSDVMDRIERATFTGKGDKPMVIGMYKRYVGGIASALQTTLAFAAIGETGQEALPPVPMVMVPPAAPLRLAPDGLVLMLTAGDASRSAGGMGGMRLGKIGDAGQVSLLLAGGDVTLEYDACAQAVLPWLPASGWDEAAFERDVQALPALADAASV